MALEGFRPTIWSKNFITNIEKALVYKNVVNTDYEGDIAGGARSVKNNEIGDITINDYTEDTDISVQTLTDAQKELVIDQKKYFAFNIDDVLYGIGHNGPAVLGIPWHDDMYYPDDKGFIKPTGDVVVGHAILARAVNVKKGYVTLRNS